jgi:hypothetical protein
MPAVAISTSIWTNPKPPILLLLLCFQKVFANLYIVYPDVKYTYELFKYRACCRREQPKRENG